MKRKGSFFEYYYLTPVEVVFRGVNESVFICIFVRNANGSINFNIKPAIYCGDTFYRNHQLYKQIEIDMPYLTTVSAYLKRLKKRSIYA
jgi:hypothetical protein